MSKLVLKLYISTKSIKSVRAEAQLRQICDEAKRNEYELMVIDVSERPQLARKENILVTPTLIKEGPGPVRRIVGDLSNKKKVLRGLDLLPSSAPTGKKASEARSQNLPTE